MERKKERENFHNTQIKIRVNSYDKSHVFLLLEWPEGTLTPTSVL